MPAGESRGNAWLWYALDFYRKKRQNRQNATGNLRKKAGFFRETPGHIKERKFYAY